MSNLNFYIDKAKGNNQSISTSHFLNENFAKYLSKITEVLNEDITYQIDTDGAITLSLDLIKNVKGSDKLDTVNSIDELYEHILKFNNISKFKLNDSDIFSVEDFKEKLKELTQTNNSDVTMDDLTRGLFLKIKSTAASERNKHLHSFFLNFKPKEAFFSNTVLLNSIIKFIENETGIMDINEKNISGEITFNKMSIKLIPLLLDKTKMDILKSIINSNLTLSNNNKKKLIENLDDFKNAKGEVEAKYYAAPVSGVVGTPKK